MSTAERYHGSKPRDVEPGSLAKLANRNGSHPATAYEWNASASGNDQG